MHHIKHYITSYCHIFPEGMVLNGKFQATVEPTFEAHLKALYKQLDLRYPKFFKMDTLSKLCFLGAEFLLEAPKKDTPNTALVFSNRGSSIETDKKHQEAIGVAKDAYPSPAVFVYTLPNIGLGEVAIRHRLYTETAFFVFERFSADFLQKYTLSLLQENIADRVLCAWVEVDGTSRHGFFYTVSAVGHIPHTATAITELFQTEHLKS